MKRATYKEISRAWLKLFEKRRALNSKPSNNTELKGVGYHYTDYRDVSAKGDTLEVWGNYVVPASDRLDVRLYIYYDRSDKANNFAYIVTSITEYFFWVIPFTYAEYIIKLPREEFYSWPLDPFDYFSYYTPQKAIPYIATADKWNINKKMDFVDTDAVIFSLRDGTGAIGYECGNNDYKHLIAKELP